MSPTPRNNEKKIIYFIKDKIDGVVYKRQLQGIQNQSNELGTSKMKGN